MTSDIHLFSCDCQQPRDGSRMTFRHFDMHAPHAHELHVNFSDLHFSCSVASASDCLYYLIPWLRYILRDRGSGGKKKKIFFERGEFIIF